MSINLRLCYITFAQASLKHIVATQDWCFTGVTRCHSFLRPRSVLMALGPAMLATHMPFIVLLLLLLVAIYLL